MSSEWKVFAAAAGGLAAGLALGYAGAQYDRQAPPDRDSKVATEGTEEQPFRQSEPPRNQAHGRAAAKKHVEAELADLLRVFAQLPMRPLVQAANGQQSAQAAARAVFVVASGKGGVGKSTISVNLAYALKDLGLSVGLLDIDIHGPSLPELIPMPPDSLSGTEHGMIVPYDYGGVGIMSWGYIQPGVAAAIRAPIATRCVSQLLSMVQWGELDCLLIDTPPGTGDVLLTLTQTLRIDGAVLVTTGNEMSIADLTKGVQLFEKVDIPTLAVCQNMATIACERCGCENDLFSDSAAERIPRLLESFQAAELHKIPLDPLLSMAPARPTSSQLHSIPYIRNPDHSDRPASRALHGLAQGLLAAFLAARLQHGRRSELRVKAGGGLELRLPGGELRPVPCPELRAACRCAECVDEFTGEQLLDRGKVLQSSSLRALAATPVGNYAVEVRFSDGHTSLLALRMIERLVGWDSGARRPPEVW